MTQTTREGKPSPVPAKATQGGDIRARWAWVEPSVWTARMLEALERGVKGGTWFSLSDKVGARRTLEAAWQQVRRNRGACGVDRMSISRFEARAGRYLAELECELTSGRYRPAPVRRCYIRKPGTRKKRALGIPTVRDRVVQAALRMVLEPIFERKFHAASYGFRPGRSCKDALRQVAALLKSGYVWVVDADIEAYFDTLDHAILMEDVRKEVADGRVLGLVAAFLKAEVMDEAASWTPEQGTPQGGVLSPLLANIYLHPVDEGLAAAGFVSVRYADDLVVLCRSREEAEEALHMLRRMLQGRKLRLHPEKTRIANALEEGFDFLGYHVRGKNRWPRRKSIKALREAIRVHTRRSNGHSLEAIIAQINPILRGWFEYFKHSKANTFPALDGWVRMRLRSILRKRCRRRGRGRGADHQRWPNTFFTAAGLFTMTEAHAAALQSR